VLTFDSICYDHTFDILLKNNFIRIIDHNALPSIRNLEELTYCKWCISFDHNTCNCNMFCHEIQSDIDNGRLRISEAQQMDRLDSIGLDGKQVLNRLALADSLKDQSSNVQEGDLEPSSEGKIVVHEAQIEDVSEDNNVTPILEDTGGGRVLSSQNKSRFILLSKENRLRILLWSMSIKM